MMAETKQFKKNSPPPPNCRTGCNSCSCYFLGNRWAFFCIEYTFPRYSVRCSWNVSTGNVLFIIYLYWSSFIHYDDWFLECSQGRV